MTTAEMLDAMERELFGWVRTPARRVEDICDEVEFIVDESEWLDGLMRRRNSGIQGDRIA